MNDAFDTLVPFYKEHLQRDRESGRLSPPEFWMMMRGFLVAAAQTYAGICLLLADKRPKPLMLQANILNRGLLEILGAVLALSEDPVRRPRILAREAHKQHATRYKRLAVRFGSDSKWTEYLDSYGKGLDIIGRAMNLTPEEMAAPEALPDEWPTPGAMIYGRPRQKIPPFLAGSRHAVLKEFYESHYPYQSAQAHGRLASMAVAMLVDQPEYQWNPGYGESHTVGTALLFVACILSEIEAAGEYARHARLAELWAYLRELDDEAKEVWTLRYEALSKGDKGV